MLVSSNAGHSYIDLPGFQVANSQAMSYAYLKLLKHTLNGPCNKGDPSLPADVFFQFFSQSHCFKQLIRL